MIDGSVLSKTFKGPEKIEGAEGSNQTAQYLYSDGEKGYFMNPTTFEQVELPLEDAEDVPKYMREGAEVQLQSFDGRVIAVDLPNSTPLKVEYTEDVVKGNTTSSVLKDARRETGITIKVPAFIKNDDVIKVDTRDGSYIERVKE